MQVKALKVFCDVVEQRSFSEAAADNGVSQSAASQMVSHVEEEMEPSLSTDRNGQSLCFRLASFFTAVVEVSWTNSRPYAVNCTSTRIRNRAKLRWRPFIRLD